MKSDPTDIDTAVPELPPEGRFLRPLDWSAFWTATVAAFAVYCYTLAPTVTLEDSGELATAGAYLGVPHPPGYPIWSLLAFCFTKLFAFVPFRGQPNPAWSIGLMSAVFGALAAGLTAMLICRSGSDLLRQSRDTLHKAGHVTEDRICWVGGVASSLLFAFSPVMWSQSVICEVYSLNAFFLILIFLLSYWWMCRPSDKLLYVTSFVFGLGLTNYQVLLLAALPLMVVILFRDLELFRDFAIAGLPLGAMLVLNGGIGTAITHPLDITGTVYLSFNILLLTLAYFFLPRGRTVAVSIAAAELGVAFYLYMPLVSDLRNPPMNWGYPRTWEGFKHAISRGQYERYNPSDVFSAVFIHQLGSYFSDLRVQFTLLAAPLGFLPFAGWTLRAGGRRFRALYAAIVLCAMGLVFALLQKWAAPGSLFLGRLYKGTYGLVILLMTVGVTALFVRQGQMFLDKLTGRAGGSISDRIISALVLLGAALGVLFYVSMLSRRIVATPGLLPRLGLLIMMAGPVLLSALLAFAMSGSDRRLRLSFDPVFQQWFIATLFGFLAMSAVLIVLANPKGDIQDAFIQKVKFISSHALYAFWIGYGLIFGLASADTFFRGNRLVLRAGLLVGLLLPLIPIRENYFNEELVRIWSGAEQNGHDFGWQFGNYQLRGAAAIEEELAPGEEPLPNPFFPSEMGPEAIFFGGTDPGRFVPTYMIYGARVREDVYLITQNALADNTYMSVMRDLYGDQIWIPAQPDSARAFQRYVREVDAGIRPRNAQLKIEGGRVQVSGVQGVMEINGILAQMIFEHNNYKNDFYVEESYVIRWMYPYLTPHGLIMQINPEQTPLPAGTVRDDLDFWDWYTRRLASDRRFRRDVVARKSFSKLRSAIGGLYAKRRRFKEAEIAFQEARILYPLSPEANFRLVQEVLLPFRRFDDGLRLMHEFQEQDPNNDKVPAFIQRLESIGKTYLRIAELEKQRKDGKMDINKAFELAECYLKAGQKHLFKAVLQGIVKTPNLPPPFLFRAAKAFQVAKMMPDAVAVLDQLLKRLPPNTQPGVLLDIAQMYSAGGQNERARGVLQAYLKREPSNWKAWVDMAHLTLTAGNTNEAVQCLGQAVRLGGQEAVNLINTDKSFERIRGVLNAARSALPGGRTPIDSLPGIRP